MPYIDDHLAGWKAGKTAEFAATKAAPKTDELIVLIRKWMHQQLGPVTADEIADGLNMSPLTIRPRLTTMKKRNLIRDSGQVGFSKMKRPMTKWELA